MQCECAILSREERAQGVMACGEDCLNRLLMIEWYITTYYLKLCICVVNVCLALKVFTSDLRKKKLNKIPSNIVSLSYKLVTVLEWSVLLKPALSDEATCRFWSNSHWKQRLGFAGCQRLTAVSTKYKWDRYIIDFIEAQILIQVDLIQEHICAGVLRWGSGSQGVQVTGKRICSQQKYPLLLHGFEEQWGELVPFGQTQTCAMSNLAFFIQLLSVRNCIESCFSFTDHWCHTERQLLKVYEPQLWAQLRNSEGQCCTVILTSKLKMV